MTKHGSLFLRMAGAVASLATLGLAAMNLAAEPRSFENLQLDSGAQQVALIELYTSEGCSSCPPADEWMSRLKDDDGLWRDYVPVALHVDYWNYIGWTDRFARAAYSERQREYVRNGGARVSYTPGFFSNGQEWRGWFNREPLDSQRDQVGNLSLGIDGDTVAVRFDPTLEYDDSLLVNIAVLGMQLESDVRSGENSGKVLKHDFVALNVQSVALEPSSTGYKAITDLAQFDTETDKLALVAWVSSRNDQKPIQAVGGYLPTLD